MNCFPLSLLLTMHRAVVVGISLGAALTVKAADRDNDLNSSDFKNNFFLSVAAGVLSGGAERDVE